MLSKRSLKESFSVEIAVAMAAILLITSLIFAYYITNGIHRNIDNELNQQAQQILKDYGTEEEFNQLKIETIDALVKSHIQLTYTEQPIGIHSVREKNHYYKILTARFPFSDKHLRIKRDISEEQNFLYGLYTMMVILGVVGMAVVFYLASRLSAQLLHPIQILSDKVSNINESILKPINIDDLSEEFKHLGESVNQLIQKINSTINFKKELFVGLAHELKTPLAVMRLKNQITNMKHKEEDYIKEALQQNLDSIDTLNNMIQNVLEFGRSEGMQFEQPKRIDIIRFMIKKAEEYELLANSKNRNFIYHFDIERFMITIQPLLFMQIFQNFIQNALRFTPEKGLVTLSVRTDQKHFIVEITDEGPGIDEKENYFAPFKRSAKSEGAGLGLFLAQNAAESMGVKLSLTNRTDGQSGAVASIMFPFNRFLHKEL